jgi:hypothetical protein
MGARRKLLWTGLLIMKKFLITVILIPLLFSQIFAEETSTEENTAAATPAPPPVVTAPLTRSRVSAIIDMEAVVVRQPFSLTFIIDYGEPENVDVIPPILHEALSIERILITPREVEQRPGTRPRPPGAEPEFQTIIEFTLISTISGQITLDPFTIITPNGVVTTNSMILSIRTADRAVVRPTQRFIWDGAPRQVTTGERITFSLRYRTMPADGSELQPPSPAFFMPQVPRGVILSQASISRQERESGIVLKLTLIPLESGTFNLPARNLLHDNVRYEIPSLSIQILPRN